MFFNTLPTFFFMSLLIYAFFFKRKFCSTKPSLFFYLNTYNLTFFSSLFYTFLHTHNTFLNKLFIFLNL
ncbi:hypothetical protein BDF21DRAFT_417979 [Thamnidium elegans]|nr:hypothetical protein BDF21DRAFT_417979 [Thamnidium elegans]